MPEASLGPALAALHLIAAALLIGVALAWGRHHGRRLLMACGCLMVAAVTLIFVTAIRAHDIPIEWITILHEGMEYKSILHLYAGAAHAGPNFTFVVSAVARNVPSLYDVVWLNLLLALINAVIFLHLAVYVAGRVWALVWTLVFALNPATFLASFSELPTNLLGLYFLAAVVAWAVLTDPLPQPRVMRSAAFVLCAVLTCLAALTRPEVALVGVVALALHAGHGLVDAEVWSAAGRRLRDAGAAPLVFLSDHPSAVVVLCVAGAWLSMAGIPGVIGRSEVAGLYPFNPSILSLYVFLPMLLLPVGVSIASLFGFVHATIHFRRFGGLALSLFILVRTYFAAQNQYYETGRYLSHILPALFLLGLYGKGAFEDIARRLLAPSWYRVACIGYLMAWFTLPLPGIAELYMRPEYDWNGGFSQLMLDRNAQREVRHLLALTAKNPQCVFVARVVEDHGSARLAPQYDYVVFGAPVSQPISVPEKEAQLEDVIARYASGAACVRLYFGGDCNLNFADRCERFIAGRRRIEEARFWSRPYNNTLQAGYAAPEVVLATYAWP